MADVLTQIQQRQLRESEQELAAAQHNLDWNSTFNRMPPDEVLRESRDFNALLANAVERKMALAAQDDEQAQRMYIRKKEFEFEQSLQPLKHEVAEWNVRHKMASTAAAGMAEKFRVQKDAEAMAHLTGFFETVGQITAPVGTPEYRAAVSSAVQRFPRIIGTQAGADALKNLQREDQDVAAIRPPEGMEIDRIDIGDDGRAKAVFKPIPPKAVAPEIPAGLVPSSVTVGPKGQVSTTFRQPEAEKANTAKPDSYDDFNKDLAAVTETYKGRPGGLPPFIQKAFEDRGKQLEAQTTGATTQPAPGFDSADAVRAAFRSGKLPRAQAEELLKGKFGLR